jgi:hypothetical protein
VVFSIKKASFMKVKLFWSKFDGESDFHSWRNRDISVSDLHQLSLRSHGHGVELFTYQNITNAPSHIVIKDADTILDAETAFESLSVRGHSIAHVSDYVRLKSCVNDGCGVVMDMDAVVLKPLPSGAFFSSMPAKQSGGMAIGWGKSHPPLQINDNSWDGKALSSFPLGIDNVMVSYIIPICNQILETLSNPVRKNTKAWNFVMWALKDIPRVESHYHVYPPLSFCPVPAWKMAGNCYSLESSKLDGRTQLFGYTMPSVEDILDNSYVVQHFFESAFKNSVSKKDLWESLDVDCLLAREAKHVLGDNWLEILTQT